MKVPPASSPFRKFLRGLTNTCLFLLLPVQLALWWVATLDHAVQMPDFAVDMIIQRLAGEGIRLQARNLWILPDLTVAGDDLTVGLEGLTGEVFTASRLELALNSGQLMVGKIEPTRVRLNGGQLWCPASIAQNGQRRALTEAVVADVTQEGRWIIIRSFQVRAGKLTLNAEGELPVSLLRLADESRRSEKPVPLAHLVSRFLSQAEQILGTAERSGGATLALRCAGNADGGADLNAHALFGNDWADKGLGLVQVRSLELRGDLRLSRLGRLTSWHAHGSADEISWQGKSAKQVQLTARGGEPLNPIQLTASIAHLRFESFPPAQLLVSAQPIGKGAWQVEFGVRTPHSFAKGSYQRTGAGENIFRVNHARIFAEEVTSIPAIAAVMKPAHLGVNGDLLLRDAQAHFNAQGDFLSATGEAACSGFSGFGLSAAIISPARALPLRTQFDFDPRRTLAPLRLRDLRLASITGEADCSLAPGGAFMLHLNGELQPQSLDRVLDGWWVSLWRILEPKQRPYAFIDVDSHWGSPKGDVRGRVLLNDFTFMGAPFRHVEVGVDADDHRTLIALHHLAGGNTEGDGFVDGLASWDWSKPLAFAGPVVKLTGNIQPWVAARCASKELGETLRGLELPPDHRLNVLVQPGPSGPSVNAEISCAGVFRAWGIHGRDLQLTTSSQANGMAVDAKLGLAGGQAELTMNGDPLHQTKLRLQLRGADPVLISKMVGELTSPAAKPAEAAAPTPPRAAAKLDLDFAGFLNVDNPRQLKGRGKFALEDPELRKIRLLGGLSAVLEAFGVGATTYELTHAEGNFGCLNGRAFFPDTVISGQQARLALAGEIDLVVSTLDFEGDFSLPRKGGFNPLDLLNLNRTLVSLTKIRVKGPISKPETSALPTLKDIIKSKKDNNLGNIPDEIKE